MKTVKAEVFQYGVVGLIELAFNGKDWFKRYQSKGAYGYQWSAWQNIGPNRPSEARAPYPYKTARLPAPTN